MNLSTTISLLHRKMNVELNVRLRKIGLSHGMARLLLHLYHHDTMTQADLCRNLEMDKSTVAKLLARMESDGLIEKQVNNLDVRSYTVSLTPKAYKLIPKIQEVMLGWSKDVTAHMSLMEKELFYQMLHEVARKAVSICHK